MPELNDKERKNLFKIEYIFFKSNIEHKFHFSKCLYIGVVLAGISLETPGIRVLHSFSLRNRCSQATNNWTEWVRWNNDISRGYVIERQKDLALSFLSYLRLENEERLRTFDTKSRTAVPLWICRMTVSIPVLYIWSPAFLWDSFLAFDTFS